MSAETEQLGKLQVEIEANISKWQRDMESLKKSAQKDAGDIEQKFSSIGPSVSKSNNQAAQSFKQIDAAILNNVKSTNDLIQVNDKLFLEVSKKTGKLQTTYRILDDIIQKNVKGSVQGWQTVATVGETALKKTSKSVSVFGVAAYDSKRKLSLLTYELANAFGQTGRFGSLIGQFAGGMLTGGFIGAGLAAGAAAINLISEKTKQLTQRIKDALSKLVDFKDKFDGLEFQIDTGNVRQQFKFIEDRVKQLQDDIANREVKLLKLRSTAGSDDVLIKKLEKENEIDEKRVIVNEEYLAKLKEQKDLEDAIGITKEELNKLGIKELTTVDKINTELNDQKKIIDDLKSQLNDPNIVGDTRLVLQNKLNKATEDYNSLLGKSTDEQNKILDGIIKKLQTENELRALTTGLSVEIMESAKATLEAMIPLVKTDEDRLKLLREIAKLTQQIADTKPPELIDPMDEPEDIILEDFDLEGRKRAIEDLKSLRISAMEDEFAQREAFIELEFEGLNEHLQELFDNRLISESELQEALANNQRAKENELANLSRQKFEAGLSAVRSIANVLQNAFGDNTLINQLTKALEIAEAIAVVIQSISLLGTLFGNPAGITGAVEAGSSGILTAKGGSVVNTGSKVSFTPWNRVPKFASGVKDFMVPGGFPNDSFPIRVQSGERVTVTPAHEVPKSGGGGNSEGLLKELIASVRAVSMNVSRLELKVDIVNNAPDVQTTVRRNKKVETRLARMGVKFIE